MTAVAAGTTAVVHCIADCNPAAHTLDHTVHLHVGRTEDNHHHIVVADCNTGCIVGAAAGSPHIADIAARAGMTGLRVESCLNWR